MSVINKKACIDNVAAINEMHLESKIDNSKLLLANRNTHLTYHSIYEENEVQMLTPLTLAKTKYEIKKSLKKYKARPSEFRSVFYLNINRKELVYNFEIFVVIRHF